MKIQVNDAINLNTWENEYEIIKYRYNESFVNSLQIGYPSAQC